MCTPTHAGVVELYHAAHGISVHLVRVSKEYVEHLFRESLREHHLEALEKRRPRIFGGMGASVDRANSEQIGPVRHGAGQVAAHRGASRGRMDSGQGASSGTSLPLLPQGVPGGWRPPHVVV